VLNVPASDGDPSPSHGQQLHAMLGLIHETGSCRDAGHVDDVLAAHGLDADERTRAEITNHLRRCPDAARAVGHEITAARFHRLPMPMFMASARIDALWEHDGILDARDYKTGRVWSEEVSHDEQARLQAYVLAPRAAAAGLRLRIAFEHLSSEVVDDPEPFEPDDDDVLAIEEKLRVVVAEIRNESFDGVADPEVCVRCRYRSICPESSTPSEPIWPSVRADGDR
jgi:PD-(D/E)XK nuclease superfamily